MKRLLLFTTAVCLLVVSHAQNKQYAGDPYAITFATAGTTPNASVQAFYRDGDAWKNFTAAHGNWYVDFNEANGMPHRAAGGGIATSGASVEERALHFIQNELNVFGMQSVDLELNQINDGKYHYIHFTQQYEGLEILWSRTTLRMTTDEYKIVMFGLDVYPDVALDMNPVLTGDAAANFASSGIDLEITGTEVLPELKILPIKTMEASSTETVHAGYSYKLVYEVRVKTNNPEGIPGDYYTLVDAHTGNVYYRQNQVHACGAYLLEASADVQAEITDNPLVATETRGLGYIRVSIDGTFYYADENGILNLDFITEPTAATIDLRGLYSRVSQGTGDTNIESISIMLMPGDNLIAFDDESGSTASEVSAYYHQNIVHDHMKFYFPDFTGLDIAQLIRVERTDGSCNAFYDGSSTNFYQAGGGCPATALFSDVVYHEYGHGINYDLYADLGDFSGMGNGAMQEGYADLWGFTITEDPILGQGFTGGSTSYVRRYDLEPKVYPTDLVGEVHADGEIIAGAWWDLAENLGDDITAMTELWVETWPAVPDGAAGDEGNIYRDVLLETLLADDDNADLGDGTPNDLAIIEAFAEHGITLLANAVVDHEELELGLIAEEPIVIEADLEVDFPVYLGDFSMYYRTSPGAAWIPTDLTEVSGDTYSAELPAQAAGTIIEYYFEVTDIYGGVAVIEPKEVNLADEPNLPYFALVGYAPQETEDFDEFFGDWVVDPFGTDDATTGIWEVDDPIGTTDGSYDNQPGADNTPGSGSWCAFTGNGPSADGLGAFDVDGGATSLISPEFDATIYEDPIFTYYRWYANDAPTSANPGNDVWQVRISNNGTDWVTVERTHTSDNSWRRNAIRISDYVTPTEEVSLLFIAQDSVIPSAELTGGSLVEAAVDDLQLWGVETAVVDTTEDTTGTGNAIAELEALNSVYPNPANQYLTLSVSSSFNSGAMLIVNQLGETVWQEQIVANGKQEYPVYTGMLPEGVYTLVLESGGLSDRTQFIIQR
jgi:Zn-dependent metalloprotease